MKHVILLAALLPACAPTYSDDIYSIERETQLRGQAPVVSIYPPEPSAQIVSPSQPEGGISRDELAAAGIPVGTAPSFGGTSYDSAAPAANLDNPGISDEQDFGAVSSRETIQSDRERLEAQREAYRVIEPEPLPQRPSNSGPNIVAYALNTVNQVGERVYSRSGLNAQNKFNRNCAKYGSSDLAQQDFLASGGPERDRMGLDPDGDGFACYWDPRPFRAARGG